MLLYNELDQEIPILTNGIFETGNDLLSQRVNFTPGQFAVADLGEVITVNKIKIAGGNSVTGGNECPNVIRLYSGSSLDSPEGWDAIANIVYETPDGLSNVSAAEAREISFDEVNTRFIKMIFESSYGNSNIAIRQIDFPISSSSPSSSSDVPKDCSLVKNDIEQSCQEILLLFDELENDKMVIDNCRNVLTLINEKGVNVSSTFVPLDNQSTNLHSTSASFKYEFEELSTGLKDLLNRMSEEAQKVGPLNFPTIV